MIRPFIALLLRHSIPLVLLAVLCHATPLAAQEPGRGWITVKNERGAFSVAMPRDTQTAVARSPKGRGDSVVLFMTTASLPDRSQFAVVYNDPVADNVILDEQASLAAMRKRLISAMSGTVLRSSAITYEGYPGDEIVMAVGEDQRVYCRTLQRGDRTYGLVARVGTHPLDSAAAMRMLGSLQLLPFRAPAWHSFSSLPWYFTASFPGIPVALDTSSEIGREGAGPSRNFGVVYARDPGSGLLYTVMAERFSSSYRADDTASLFNEITQRFLRTGDSIVEQADLRVDRCAAREVIARHAAGPVVKRLLMVLHGDNFFVLSLVAPSAESRSAVANTFFDSFHTSDPLTSADLFSSRLPSVLEAIDGRDPGRAAAAYVELTRMRLGRRDNPTIYAVLEHPRPDDSLGAASVRGLLIRALSYTPDSATIVYLARLLPALPAHGGLRAAAITYIAWIGTPEALDTAAALLTRYRGSLGGDEIDPFFTLRDQPARVATALSDFFPLLDVAGVRDAVLTRAEALLRDQRGAAMIAPSVPAFVAGMRAMIARRAAAGASTAERDAMMRVVTLAGTLPANDSLDMVLRQVARDSDQSVRRCAVLVLARRKASVPTEALESLAADPRQAVLLFDGLSSLGRIDLFPTRFRDQRVIGASRAVVEMESAGAIVDSIAVQEVRELTFEGAPRRFLLLRYRTVSGESWMPAVVGPFPLTATNLDPSAADVWIGQTQFTPGQATAYFSEALGWFNARRSVR